MKYVLVLIVGLTFIFSGCSKERHATEISRKQQQLLSYIPSNVQFVMYMNIAELRSSVYWDEYLSPTINDYKENFWITGFLGDDKREIKDYIGDFMLGSLDTERSIKVYRFTSGEKKLKNYLNNKNFFSKNTHDGSIYYESIEKPGSFFILSEPSLLITLNWEAGLKDLLNDEYTPIKGNKKFIAIIEQIGNKEKYWMATDRGTFASAMMRKILASNGYKQVIKVLSTVNSITFAADFTNNIDVESVWECNDPASSGLIAAAARSAIAMDLFSDKEYALGKIMDKVSVETDVSDVVFKVDLNRSDIKELKNIAEKRNLDKKL